LLTSLIVLQPRENDMRESIVFVAVLTVSIGGAFRDGPITDELSLVPPGRQERQLVVLFQQL
jgi:hypothetical protein